MLEDNNFIKKTTPVKRFFNNYISPVKNAVTSIAVLSSSMILAGTAYDFYGSVQFNKKLEKLHRSSQVQTIYVPTRFSQQNYFWTTNSPHYNSSTTNSSKDYKNYLKD